MNWFDKACAELDNDLEEGVITYQEYHSSMRSLWLEYQDSPEFEDYDY
jgi:hypothetical protein